MAAYHIVLDFEMNPVPCSIRHRFGGLATEIIEIGAVKIDARTCQVIDRYCQLVRPQFNQRIEPDIAELTGITTRSVAGCPAFQAAMEDFIRWIDAAPNLVYCWSPNDLYQLKKECRAKGVKFPKVLAHWIDFQKRYPIALGLPGQPCMSLEKAAHLAGIPVLPNLRHQAVYDAEITAKLIQLTKTGMYQFNSYRVRPAVAAGIHDMTYSIGDVCSDALRVWLSRFDVSEKKEYEPYDIPGYSAGAELLRI